MNPHAATFERYYQGTDDPWGFRTRWYERRKRALLQAVLPRKHYDSAWEIGCANGELAATLAPGCERLLATDGNDVAVRAARDPLADFPGAVVEPLWVPEQWPEGTFDLIVLSELAYYLDARSLSRLSQRLISSLRSDGHLIACHWRPPIDSCAITGDEAHASMNRELPWRTIVRHEEADFLLEVWAADGRSVAEIEGLR